MTVTVPYKQAHASDSQKTFIESLNAAQEWFDDRGIEYRIIGSVATSAYLDGKDRTSLNFNRPGARTQSEKVPDVDLVIPRESLEEARSFRDQNSNIKLGLAFPTRFIDFRPGESQSFLTYRDLKAPVDTSVFGLVPKELLGNTINTVNPKTLLNTHLMMGKVRPKDRNKVAQLSDLVEHSDLEEADYSGFDAFMEKWANGRSLIDASIQTTLSILDKLPPATRLRAVRCALVLASIGKLR